ncbi:(deoxy)nucleoside triphosphate pyrophosphohydrolase [Planotetraspora sp. A-T 1434]|uniref:(deoxy)nucleoside triphosphate pyrophosphohydrolase n=1 Tax=Planotetraspora sp. A-T 1434 TaxID=2979219 RepID=UPI0021C1C05F|nr:(deoxy)nucleoside triphosphate pyrophosphohydrolase [Planotetraspora sp. A-T 1434]MCT9932661.1 (deoxy)nucleoside triphosphate pyrophosphohydrolase [Planotetraspora sp. A-T 1434]
MEKVVVGAAIVEGGRLLAAQRAEPPALRGGWEFPGGKVDPGESDHEALIRECVEELGVEIVVGRRVGEDWPLSNGYVMRVWLAEIVRGVPHPHEHLALRWLEPRELYDVPWLPADLPIVAAVEKLLWGPAGD